MASTTATPSGKRSSGMADWRAGLRRRLKPPRKLEFTREGKYFTGMTLLIGFGAINTGNNLLYLLLGMMLALIIISGVMSESVLQKLEVHRRLPERIFAGQPALAEVTLINHKLRAPSFSIQILERIVGVPLVDRPAVYFMRVAPNHAQATGQYRFAWPRRGRWRIEGVEVATRFPFDLFRKSRDFDTAAEVIVYPMPLDPPDIHGIAARPQGDVRRHRIGGGGDFYGLRDLRQGDDARAVHWKSSARRGELLVRESEEEETRAVVLCLHNRWGAGDSPAPSHRARLEEAVGLCAGLAQQLLARGFAVGLATLDESIPVNTGAGHFDRILRALALAAFHGDPELDEGQRAALSPSPRFATAAQDNCIVVGAGAPPAPAQGKVLAMVRT